MKRQIYEKKEILNWAKGRQDPFSSTDLVDKFGMSRQTAARVLKELVEQGQLYKQGSTRTASYSSKKPKERAKTNLVQLKKSLAGLAEDKVFEEVNLKMGLKKVLSENTFGIAYYAFTEMLNNAIDHSQSPKAEIIVKIEFGRFHFQIKDLGIGLFKKIRQGFDLKTDEEAVEHLLKGKQTTAPEAHSGQGIFFTSKIANQFSIRSGRLELTFDNEKDDLRLTNTRPLKGTEVSFSIKLQTRKSLQKLFEQYANDDFDFDRTNYPILILKQNGTISRSQARRLTAGLEKFDRIILDFKKVKDIGQGFADEIFRVFQSRHPKMIIEARNASSAVDFMIRRTKK